MGILSDVWLTLLCSFPSNKCIPLGILSNIMYSFEYTKLNHVLYEHSNPVLDLRSDFTLSAFLCLVLYSDETCQFTRSSSGSWLLASSVSQMYNGSNFKDGMNNHQIKKLNI
jgi:hypothetical protein